MRCRYGPCEAESLKERMKRAVALLGPEEVQEIVRKEGKIEVRCSRITAQPSHYSHTEKCCGEPQNSALRSTSCCRCIVARPLQHGM